MRNTAGNRALSQLTAGRQLALDIRKEELLVHCTMLLVKKIVGCTTISVILVAIITLVWFVWPGKIEVQTEIDTSENQDNEKNLGLIEGSASNSQNNNQRHYNISGQFTFTILIFLLLLIQSISQTLVFIRYMTGHTGSSETTKSAEAHPTPDSQPPLPTYYSQQPGQNQFCYPSQQPTSPPPLSPSPGHVYYEPAQKQVTIECQQQSKEEEINYKELYSRLKLRSSAAGLDV